MKTKPIRVTWTSDDELQCAILAGMGFSTKLITEQTGLTACQVSYRLHKGQIYRKDYRDGSSDVAQRMMNSAPTSGTAIRALLNLKVIK